MREVTFVMPCLDTRSVTYPADAIVKHKMTWAKDSRRALELAHRFCEINSKAFDFLETTVSLEGAFNNLSLFFRSGRLIGAVPLLQPDTGTQCGDFVLIPRYMGYESQPNSDYQFTSYAEIVNMLGEEIEVRTFNSHLHLKSGQVVRPPLYHLALRFITSLVEVTKATWVQFESKELFLREPRGTINWNRYYNYEYDPERRLKFPVRKSFLSIYHDEYAQLRYVYDLCKKELIASQTPVSLKVMAQHLVGILDKKLYPLKPKKVTEFRIHLTEPMAIKRSKTIANEYLKGISKDALGWSVNMETLFERYVQYCFRRASARIGGEIEANPKIGRRGWNSGWGIKYLEPDVVFKSDDAVVFIDAKYKSYLLNTESKSEYLKDTFRADLHQILAYTAFGSSSKSAGILCYPRNDKEMITEYKPKLIEYNFSKTGGNNRIYIVGIPFVYEKVHEAVNIIEKTLLSVLREE